jgi:hypothetical protein
VKVDLIAFSTPLSGKVWALKTSAGPKVGVYFSRNQAIFMARMLGLKIEHEFDCSEHKGDIRRCHTCGLEWYADAPFDICGGGGTSIYAATGSIHYCAACSDDELGFTKTLEKKEFAYGKAIVQG